MGGKAGWIEPRRVGEMGGEERGRARVGENLGAQGNERGCGTKGWEGELGLGCSKFYRMADFVDRSAGGSRPSYGSRGEGGWEVCGMTGVVGMLVCVVWVCVGLKKGCGHTLTGLGLRTNDVTGEAQSQGWGKKGRCWKWNMRAKDRGRVGGDGGRSWESNMGTG